MIKVYFLRWHSVHQLCTFLNWDLDFPLSFSLFLFSLSILDLFLSSGDTFPLSLWIWHKEGAFPNDNKTVFSWEVSAQREIC